MGEPLQRGGPHPQRYSDLLWLLVLGLLWGSSYLFIKVTVAEVPALTLVAGRLALGATLLWLMICASGQSVPRSRSAWVSFFVMGIFSGAVPWSLISWGEQFISSGLAALLQATMPIFTVLLVTTLTRDERLGWTNAAGVVLGFAGVGILMLPDLCQGQQASLLGQLAVVLSSASYAGATVFARDRLRGESPLISAAGQLTAGAVVMVPIGLVVDRPFQLSPSAAATACWIGLTILGTVLAYIIYYSLIQRASATFVSTVTYVIPVTSLILGVLILGEPISVALGISLALILLGVLLVRS